MRRGTIVAGLTVGIIGVGVGGMASASAASLPITVDFTSGTVKIGSNSATQVGTSQLVGTIETDTLVAKFPATGVTFAKATTGNFSVTPKATGTITGNPNLTTGSLDLSGPIAYDIAGGGDGCTISPTAPITLTGSAINALTGAYGVSGTGQNLSLSPSTLTDADCAPYVLNGTLGSTTLTYAGKLTVPGVIPVPSTVVVVPPTTPKPTTPTTQTPTPAVKAGKLSVSVSKPKTVKRGKSTVTKVVVRNTGAGSAKSVTVRLAASGKGVTPRSTSKTYSSIAAGKSRTFSVRLKTKRTSAKRSAVKVTVQGASGLSASRSTTLRLR